MPEEFGKPDHTAGQCRKLGTKTLEHHFELRHHLEQQDSADDHRNQEHRQRVGHGFTHPRLEPLSFFPVTRHPLQQGVEGAGLLAGVNQVAVELVEVLRLFAQGGGQAAAGHHVQSQVLQQAPHAWVVEAFGDDVEGLQQRHSGLEHGRHLPSEERDILGSNPLASAEQGGEFFAYFARDDAALAQLGLDQGRSLRARFAGHFAACSIGALPGVQADLCCFDRHDSILDDLSGVCRRTPRQIWLALQSLAKAGRCGRALQ
ncbi:hypothetical protein EMIT0P176_20037 [Pseudomonas sp. IT-P176]